MPFYLMKIFGQMYRLQYDKSNLLKKDKEQLFQNQKISMKIKLSLEQLAQSPLGHTLDIKKLEPKAENKYRMRVQDYRIIYSVDCGNRIIIVHRIAKRKEVYRI